jgi:hypothetical protein
VVHPVRGVREDAELVAAARNALPTLLAVAEAAKAIHDRIERVRGAEGVTGDVDYDRLADALSRLEASS